MYRAREFGRNAQHGEYELHSYSDSQEESLLATSLPSFLKEIESIKGKISEIDSNVERLKNVQSAMLREVSARELEEKRRQANDVTDRTQDLMADVKAQLKRIEPKSGNSDLDIRKKQFAGQLKRYMDAIQAHWSTARSFEEEERKKTMHQIRIANPTASEQEIEQAVAAGGPVYGNQLLQSTQRLNGAQDVQNAVMQRHQDVQHLAKSLQELSELFTEMQFLLESQKKVLDNVETLTREVVTETEKGNQHLDRGIVLAIATRRKKWICFGIFITIILIIAIVLAVHFTSGGGGGSSSSSSSSKPSTNSTSGQK